MTAHPTSEARADRAVLLELRADLVSACALACETGDEGVRRRSTLLVNALDRLLRLDEFVSEIRKSRATYDRDLPSCRQSEKAKRHVRITHIGDVHSALRQLEERPRARTLTTARARTQGE